MSQTTNAHNDTDETPSSAEELVEKHGRTKIEALAEQGNIAARAALDIVDEDTEAGGRSD